MTQYLCIQNPGQAPVEGWTTLGVSTTRYDGNSRTIGQFGSGNKQSINLLLRLGLSPIVYCGPTRLEFFTEELPVDDGLTSHQFHKVMCRITGKIDGKNVKRTEDCGFTTEYGVQDWTNIDMALREFISNAIDRTERQEGGFEEALSEGRLSLTVVDEDRLRAKADYTRVYVPYTDDVIRYHAQVGRRFLHFSEPENLNKTLLPKGSRNVTDRKVAVVYRKGVFVREIEGSDLPSLFDYNFGDELQIDESRNISDWHVKSAASFAVRDADSNDLAVVFRSLIERGQEYWEHGLDRDYLSTYHVYDFEKKEKIQNNWREGWEQVAGEGVLCREESFVTEMVEKKGHRAIPIHKKAEAWAYAAQQIGSVKTSSTVMTEHEAAGRTTVPATEPAQKAVDLVWLWAELVDMTFDKQKPQVRCFKEVIEGGQGRHGYYAVEDGVPTVFINEAEANDGLNKQLLRTAFEEVVHHITGATDMSRDFQEFLIQVIVEFGLALEK